MIKPADIGSISDDVVLCRETPAVESLLALVDQVQTFVVTSYPEVVF